MTSSLRFPKVNPFSLLSRSYCRSPHGHWNNQANHRLFFEVLGSKLGYASFEAFQKLTKELITSLDGSGVLAIYDNSPLKALKDIYPEYVWLPWKLKSTPNDFWTNKKNQRIFFDWLAVELGYTVPEDWYKIDKETIHVMGGSRLMDLYDGSPFKALNSIYPESNWICWKLKCTSMNFWKDEKNQRTFFDSIANEIGYDSFEKWYGLSKEIIGSLGGYRLLAKYGDSPIKALKSIYPEYRWVPWKLNSAPNDFWNDWKNRRNFFDWLGKEVGYDSVDNWYGISLDLISALGGRGLICLYNESPLKALKSIYPEHDWIGWKLKCTPMNFWEDKDNHRIFFDWMRDQLGLETFGDLYKFGLDTIYSLGGDIS